jgi:hypothetical protein
VSKDEALKLAMDALINHEGNYKLEKAGSARSHKAIAAIKQALAAPTVQEPVAWMHEWDDGEQIPMLRKREVDSSDIDSPKSVRPLVFGDTTPPAQPAPVQEPVASLKEADVLMMAEAHGIDPSTKGLYGFYIDCISNQPTAQPAPVPLTDEQIESLLPDDDTPMSLGEAFVKFARLVEAAHGITEKGQP